MLTTQRLMMMMTGKNFYFFHINAHFRNLDYFLEENFEEEFEKMIITSDANESDDEYGRERSPKKKQKIN